MIEFDNVEDARTLAQAIVNTIADPFVVLDDRFCVVAASRSFHETFRTDAGDTRGKLLYSLNEGRWDIPALRDLLERIIPERTEMNGFEVESEFPGLGHKVMLLNARRVIYLDHPKSSILLAFSDITERRANEREKDQLLRQAGELLRQKEVLLQELQHRVANSLQIIASILLLKARGVTSEETRQHLQDAHQRVMSVAEVQRHLHVIEGIDQIEVRSYLATLCRSLALSMVAESQPIRVEVIADQSRIGSDKAVSLGLIVTELVINAIKYAFPVTRTDASILVSYEVEGADWKLIVSDNGVGKDAAIVAGTVGGLGTAIVQALVQQLDARIDIESSASGTIISITHATFTSRIPRDS